MKKVILTKGLPASGKSTWAKSMVDKGGYFRINKDSIRDMAHNNHYSKNNEKIVERVRDDLIVLALEAGQTPIVDDTNLAPRHYKHIKELIKGIAEIEIKEFNVDVEECIKRDLKRPVSVGERVIRDMWNQFYRETEQYIPPTGTFDAILVDVDGTLTVKVENGRGWFDWSRVGEDKVNEKIADIVREYNASGVKVIIVSGRDGICYNETKKWLEDNEIPFDYLFMRAEGDMRQDAIIKKEIYDENIRDKFNILFVLDDRPQVCRMWHALGLTLLKVGDPDLDF
jgi:predicted kinase